MQYIQIACSLGLAPLAATDAPIWMLFVMQLGVGIGNSLNAPAWSALLPSRPLPRKRWSAVMTCCSRQRASFSNRGATGSEARFGSATRSRYARRAGTTVSDVDANLGKAGRPGFRSPVTPFLTPLLPMAPCDFFRFGVDAPRLGVSNPDADENCACAPIASLVCAAPTEMEDRRLPRAFVSRSRSR